MSGGRKLHCDVHDMPRVQYDTCSRCPRCDAEQQERYRRAKGHAPRAVLSPEERLQAQRDRRARYEAWRAVQRAWQRFAALPVEVQREAVRGLR